MLNIKNTLRELMLHPMVRGLDLDSIEATEIHTELIRNKAFLRKQYEWYYAKFVSAHDSSPPGVRLEIGSGAGFLHERIPDLVTSDLRPGARVDIRASACDLPFESQSVGTIFMLNVLHHIPDVRRFFSEATRVLCPNGRVILIEPYVSMMSKGLYQALHHEPFDPASRDWELPNAEPMSTSNGALPWIVFVRDRLQFEAEFPELEIHDVDPHTALTYVLSGGVSMRSLLPGIAFGPVAALEKSLGPAIRHIASMMTVELRHQKKG
jgi:SAM-dependent methyltransferase